MGLERPLSALYDWFPPVEPMYRHRQRTAARYIQDWGTYSRPRSGRWMRLLRDEMSVEVAARKGWDTLSSTDSIVKFELG